MSKFKIKVQKPTTELVVKSKEVSSAKGSVIAGLRRYKAEETEQVIKEWGDILNSPNINIYTSDEVTDFLKKNILYLRSVEILLDDEETGKEKTYVISDTRNAKPLEGLWDTPEECLDALLDDYFSWGSWRLSFIEAVQLAIADIEDVKDDKIKN